jgi:RNA-directed DNA polymerase
MRRSDCHLTSATWGARCGKSARRVLRGGTGTSGIVARPVPTHHNLDKSWLVQFVEHRVADPRILRLIQKWLNAGVMEEGEWSNTKTGSPQGSVISPLLANIYLHYAFDLWVNVWRKKWAHGEVAVIRYADDVILGFQHQTDADRFLENLRERLGMFGLELHPDKTRRIEFGRFAEQNRERRGEGKPETFDFLGFSVLQKHTDKEFIMN